MRKVRCFSLIVLVAVNFLVTPCLASPMDDLDLAKKVTEKLLHANRLKAGNMVISSFNGVVHLSGSVGSREELEDIFSLVRSVKGVKGIQSDMTAVFRARHADDPWGF